MLQQGRDRLTSCSHGNPAETGGTVSGQEEAGPGEVGVGEKEQEEALGIECEDVEEDEEEEVKEEGSGESKTGEAASTDDTMHRLHMSRTTVVRQHLVHEKNTFLLKSLSYSIFPEKMSHSFLIKHRPLM